MSKSSSEILKKPLTLPCGTRIKNRLCKSAMNENLASVNHSPTSLLTNLYGKWADGGIGLCITGIKT